MHGVILASVTDNSPHGYNLTFAFPMILFIVIAGGLYLIYSRPHKVPGHGPLRISGARQGSGGAVSQQAAGAHAASASTTSGSVSEDENQVPDAGPASDQPAAPGDSAAGTPPSKDEASE